MSRKLVTEVNEGCTHCKSRHRQTTSAFQVFIKSWKKITQHAALFIPLKWLTQWRKPDGPHCSPSVRCPWCPSWHHHYKPESFSADVPLALKGLFPQSAFITYLATGCVINAWLLWVQTITRMGVHSPLVGMDLRLSMCTDKDSQALYLATLIRPIHVE